MTQNACTFVITFRFIVLYGTCEKKDRTMHQSTFADKTSLSECNPESRKTVSSKSHIFSHNLNMMEIGDVKGWVFVGGLKRGNIKNLDHFTE